MPQSAKWSELRTVIPVPPDRERGDDRRVAYGIGVGYQSWQSVIASVPLAPGDDAAGG